MENLKDKAENLTDHITDYVETYMKLTVLNATDKAAGFASTSITAMVLVIFSLFVLLFLSIGLGWWIGQQLNNMLAGFCIVAGIYAILATTIVLLRKTLLLPYIKNIIIRIAYE